MSVCYRCSGDGFSGLLAPPQDILKPTKTIEFLLTYFIKPHCEWSRCYEIQGSINRLLTQGCASYTHWCRPSSVHYHFGQHWRLRFEFPEKGKKKSLNFLKEWFVKPQFYMTMFINIDLENSLPVIKWNCFSGTFTLSKHIFHLITHLRSFVSKNLCFQHCIHSHSKNLSLSH